MNLLTTKEIAESLRVSRPTVIKFRKEGMPCICFSRSQGYRYDYDDCRRWLQEKYGIGTYKDEVPSNESKSSEV